ncbi:hypothetical protein VTN49DRAFT_1552 [Thermomyces lanuginosus]|uniref:uncharacterized protein n=1 Tax=Thermomyces lanuginosus TaxID=5541 RepID=UPI00374366C7
MSERAKRRRVGHSSEDTGPEVAVLDERTHLYSIPDRGSWKGFCEIESEPALFNVMLREFGVKNVKVQEVVSLDDSMLQLLPKPVYGLIFLFRWREDDPGKQEAICPDGLWFANQTAPNACASVALLNIVNNVDDIDLGDQLRNFKEFTMPFTPALRGDAVANFEFVKRIHNSFARNMDILNTDLQLKNEATAPRKYRSKKQQEESADAAFHFIAFVPALGQIWKFDGLERQPQNLGPYSGSDWLELVKPEIIARMMAYEEDQIEFSVLGLVKDPLINHVNDLAANIKLIQALRDRLSKLLAGDAAPALLREDELLEPDASYNLTQDDIDRASVPDDRAKRLESIGTDELLKEYTDLREAQRAIRASIKEELQSRQMDEEYAEGRRHDYTAAITLWARMLARKGVIRELVEETK